MTRVLSVKRENKKSTLKFQMNFNNHANVYEQISSIRSKKNFYSQLKSNRSLFQINYFIGVLIVRTQVILVKDFTEVKFCMNAMWIKQKVYYVHVLIKLNIRCVYISSHTINLEALLINSLSHISRSQNHQQKLMIISQNPSSTVRFSFSHPLQFHRYFLLHLKDINLALACQRN